MYMYIWLCGVLVTAHRILSLLRRVESLVTACELLAAACAIWLPEHDGSQVPCTGSGVSATGASARKVPLDFFLKFLP